MIKGKFYLGTQRSVPEAIQDWAESLKHTAGIYSTRYQDLQVYLIAAGPKPTGGYRVLISPVREGQAGRLYYMISPPAVSDFVIQIITYPYEIVWSEDAQPLTFYNKDGESEKEMTVTITSSLT